MSHQGYNEDGAGFSMRTLQPQCLPVIESPESQHSVGSSDSGYGSMVHDFSCDERPHDQKSGLPKPGLPKLGLPKLGLLKLRRRSIGFRRRSIGRGLTTFFGDEFEYQKVENFVDSDNSIPRVATRPNESVKSSIQVGYVKVHTPNVSYKE